MLVKAEGDDGKGGRRSTNRGGDTLKRKLGHISSKELESAAAGSLQEEIYTTLSQIGSLSLGKKFQRGGHRCLISDN